MPELFGKVIVRSSVGSVMANVVSYASAVAPSKTGLAWKVGRAGHGSDTAQGRRACYRESI